jgi:transposase
MCSGLYGVGLLDFWSTTSVEGAVCVSKPYPEEFRRKVLDLVAAGRPVAQIAADLGISDQTIYIWRKQELIDAGSRPGATSEESAELKKLRREVSELRRTNTILKTAAAFFAAELCATRRQVYRKVVRDRLCWAVAAA